MSIYAQIKTCSKCKESKPFTEYNKCKSSKDGLQHCCKYCLCEYRKSTKEYRKEYKKEYYLNNKDKIREYQNKTKEQIKQKRNENRRNRRSSDPLYKLKGNISNLIRKSIKKKGFKKNTKTQNILGCTIQQFKEHLESQFNENMNWNNQGTYWDIDHIIPVSISNTEEEIIELNHYTNLRPLESYYNRHIKRNNIL